MILFAKMQLGSSIGAKLFLFILITSLLTSCVSLPLQGEALSPVMYLVPTEQRLLEAKFTPENLNKANVMEVGFTDSWQTIMQQAAKGELQAVIIHHAAVGQVNSDELAELGEQWIVVAGIGISPNELAALLQLPASYDNLLGRALRNPIRFRTPYYFYAYSYHGTGSRTTTDSIADIQGVWRMLSIVDFHIAAQAER